MSSLESCVHSQHSWHHARPVYGPRAIADGYIDEVAASTTPEGLLEPEYRRKSA
jgi:hypothetical protein